MSSVNARLRVVGLLLAPTLLLALAACSGGGNPLGLNVGAIQVTTSTTGSNLDPDGYSVEVGDTLVQSPVIQNIGINSTVTFTPVPVGTYPVTLTGVASNCTVTSNNPQTASVPAGGTAQVTFDITCTAQTGPGTIQVTTSTTGSNLDPDGYSVEVGDTLVQSPVIQNIGINSTVTFTPVPVGTYPVTLTGVASNCTVTSNNPQTASVPAGGTAQVTFDITCTAQTGPGTIQVTTSTTGSNLDPDGYSVAVDTTLSQSVGVNNTVTFTSVPAGSYTVTLSGVAPNCVVTSNNPQTAIVPAGGTVQVTFDVLCTAQTGDVDVSASTTGFDLDPDGYTVIVAGTQSQPLTVNGLVTFTIAATTVDVELTGVATNCTVTSNNPQTVSVPAGGTVSVSFAVTCTATGKILFASDRDVSTINEIYVMNADGTSVVRLTSNTVVDDQPAWSPDGTQIVFATARDGNSEVYVMNPDGTNPVNLTNNGAGDQMPAWSPLDSAIAFVTNRDGNWEIYVMDINGANPVRLTNDTGGDLDPTWSPDGSKIAFTTDRDGDKEIYVMNADGTNPVNLTNNSGAVDEYPAWSPDGLKIAFSTNRDGNAEVYVMDADGTNPVRLTNDSNVDYQPSWSPDGSKIAFATFRDSNLEIYVMNANGTGLVNLTTNLAWDWWPAWRP